MFLGPWALSKHPTIKHLLSKACACVSLWQPSFFVHAHHRAIVHNKVTVLRSFLSLLFFWDEKRILCGTKTKNAAVQLNTMHSIQAYFKLCCYHYGINVTKGGERKRKHTCTQTSMCTKNRTGEKWVSFQKRAQIPLSFVTSSVRIE